jgi:hypothetical protein
MRCWRYSLLAGCIFGLLPMAVFATLAYSSSTVPLWLLNLAAVLAFPGNFAAFEISASTHGGNILVATLTNFIFYFGLGLLGSIAWEKTRVVAKNHSVGDAQTGPRPPANG